VSEAGDRSLRLIAGGMSRKQIGSSIGRNDRLIGYVEKGVKPGHNLVPSLQQLAGELEARREAGVPPRRGEVVPVRRRRGRRGRGQGGAQRVRRPTVISESAHHSTSRIGKQAAESGGGGRGLAKLLEQKGGTVAFDVAPSPSPPSCCVTT
jgi:hypothetical protein